MIEYYVTSVCVTVWCVCLSSTHSEKEQALCQAEFLRLASQILSLKTALVENGSPTFCFHPNCCLGEALRLYIVLADKGIPVRCSHYVS